MPALSSPLPACADTLFQRNTGKAGHPQEDEEVFAYTHFPKLRTLLPSSWHWRTTSAPPFQAQFHFRLPSWLPRADNFGAFAHFHIDDAFLVGGRNLLHLLFSG